MLQFVSWEKWQASSIGSIRRARKSRNAPTERPANLFSVSIATTWDYDFLTRFAPLVGQRKAETYFIRALMYAGKNDGLRGRVLVERHEFGHLVLSRSGDTVTRSEGEKVYDALISSGIAVTYHVTSPVTGSKIREDKKEDVRDEQPHSDTPTAPGYAATRALAEKILGLPPTPKHPSETHENEVSPNRAMIAQDERTDTADSGLTRDQRNAADDNAAPSATHAAETNAATRPDA